MSQSQMVKRASEALNEESAVAVGEYTTSYAGSSVTASMAQEFCRYHGIETGHSVKQWFDYQSGALIILPAGENE